MKKFVLGTLLLVALAVAAQQLLMAGTKEMMQACPMAGMMGSSDVKYEATPTGASVLFTPKDPAKLNEVQTKVREIVEHMKKMEGLHGNLQPAK